MHAELTRASLEAQAPPHRVPSVVYCGCLLVAVKAALKIAGFQRTIRWIRAHVVGAPEIRPAPPGLIESTEYAVALAAALYPGRALCLEQSLVLYFLLRRQGIGVKYCQGILSTPFQAHAWVEYCGNPVNGIPEHINRFARFPDQLP